MRLAELVQAVTACGWQGGKANDRSAPSDDLRTALAAETEVRRKGRRVWGDAFMEQFQQP